MTDLKNTVMALKSTLRVFNDRLQGVGKRSVHLKRAQWNSPVRAEQIKYK